MKLRVIGLVFVFTVASLAAASDAPAAQSTTAFARLKSLAGEWESKDAQGKVSQTRYEVVAGGSAVVEHFTSEAMGADNAMETVYYLDGNRLLLTHYCMAHNQPRMQASAFDPATGDLRFTFLDATGLATPNAGHMHNVSFRFVDDNHFVADWQFFQDGKPKMTESIQYTRVR